MSPRLPILVVAGIVVRDGCARLTERVRGTHLAGRWELPGGKVDPGEDPGLALVREWREELDVELADVEPWTFAWHSYPAKTVLILFYRATLQGEPTPREGQRMAWVPLRELGDLPLPEADRAVIDALISEAP